MKGLLFILLSIGMKAWHERQRDKLYMTQVIRYLEEEELKRKMVRINVRARTVD